MIRMHEQIRRELVVVPYEAVLEVIAPCVQGSLGKVGIEDKAVEAVYEYVHARNLSQCPPRMLLAQSQCHQRVGGRFSLTPVYHGCIPVHVVGIAERHSCLAQHAVAVLQFMIVVASVAITD